MGKNKDKKSSSQEQEEQQNQILEEDEQLEQHQEEQDLQELQFDHRRQLEVLQILAAQTKEGMDGEKLTFLALYSLKQKEIDLNQKMIGEINAVKDKFELLKQPLYAKLTSAAIGKKLEKELYKPEGIDTSVDVNKVTPTPLPEFWTKVFQKSGLVQDAQDIQTLRKLQEFNCELLDTKTNHLRVTFKFKEQPSIFSNKLLVIEVVDNVKEPEKDPKVTIKEPIKFKGVKNEQSIFTELFSPKSNPNQVKNLINELYRDYCNSIYFYLRKDDEDVKDIAEIDNGDSQSPEQKVDKAGKATKSSKSSKNDVGSKKGLEKPECKNQ